MNAQLPPNTFKRAVVVEGATGSAFTGQNRWGLVNLPVEFDASRRAKRILQELGLVQSDEAPAVRRVLSAAAMIVSTVSVATVWSISAVLIVVGISLQIVGHRIFERRQPALLDNPTHLLLGPMFVMAKLFIALGFRRDLALIIHPVPQAAHPGASFYADARHGETHPNS